MSNIILKHRLDHYVLCCYNFFFLTTKQAYSLVRIEFYPLKYEVMRYNFVSMYFRIKKIQVI